jgi:thiol-disulfide isomerase/thioredoxin
LLTALSVGYSNALYEDSPLFKETSSYQAIADAIGNSDKLIGLYLYNQYDCPKCEQLFPIIERLAEEFEGIVDFRIADCDKYWEKETDRTFFPVCDPKRIEDLPQITFY